MERRGDFEWNVEENTGKLCTWSKEFEVNGFVVPEGGFQGVVEGACVEVEMRLLHHEAAIRSHKKERYHATAAFDTRISHPRKVDYKGVEGGASGPPIVP